MSDVFVKASELTSTFYTSSSAGQAMLAWYAVDEDPLTGWGRVVVFKGATPDQWRRARALAAELSNRSALDMSGPWTPRSNSTRSFLRQVRGDIVDSILIEAELDRLLDSFLEQSELVT